jgi:RNA-splicing ligase RtcB
LPARRARTPAISGRAVSDDTTSSGACIRSRKRTWLSSSMSANRRADRVTAARRARLHELDSQVAAQLKRVASLAWVVHHVAVMPDVHAGRGATVGSVIAMRAAVAPGAVGVDIGCGMTAVQTTLAANDLPDDLRRLRTAIEKVVPVGQRWHDEPAWESATDALRAAGETLMDGYRGLSGRSHSLGRRVACQLGTLGGGNHFIEVCLDTAGSVWLMLHSGSRGVIIPGSIGGKSFIVRGRGNPASFQSASHSAGRRMSRTEARRRFSVADLRAQTEGVDCRKDPGVIDEAPKAYKNIDKVMAQQEDLVEIVAELKQVVCVKG